MLIYILESHEAVKNERKSPIKKKYKEQKLTDKQEQHLKIIQERMNNG